MAMNGTNLGDEMLAAIQTLSSGDQADAQKALRKIGEAIVAHIQANATVLIKTSDSGLQRENDGGSPPTLAPAATKTLPGGAIQ